MPGQDNVIERPAATLSVVPVRTLHRDVLVPAASVLALNATPVTLVPAPGTGLALSFVRAVIHKPAGTAYAGIAAGEDLSFRYTDGSGTEMGECEATGFLDQATAQTREVVRYAAASLISSSTPTANAAIVLHMLAGEITTGDSPLHVRVIYHIIPAAAFAV